MRDVIVSLFIIGLLPACYRRPLVGLMMFSLLAYMRLQDLTWGFAREQRWSYYVAIVTAFGFLADRQGRPLMRNDLRCWIMIILVLFSAVGLVMSPFFRFGNDLSLYLEYVKVVTIALFTTAVVQRRDHLRLLLWVIALSFGFFGIKNGMHGLATGLRLRIWQGPGGMLEDNNDFALALCMSVPMLLYVGLSERNLVIRRFFLGCVPFTMLTIFLTYSRGAFLSLTVTMLLVIWRSRNRVGGFLIFGLCGLGAILVAPGAYLDRIGTITEYETEGSAQGRLRAWGIAMNMIEAHPLAGVGLGKFRINYPLYDPLMRGKGPGTKGAIVAHNSYLQIWAENGTPAFALYLLLFLLSFYELWKLRRQARLLYHQSWILNYINMFEASLLAFMIGSTFLNRAQFDLFYHWVALIVVFGVIAREEMAHPATGPVRHGLGGTLTIHRPRGFQSGFRQPAGLAPSRGF